MDPLEQRVDDENAPRGPVLNYTRLGPPIPERQSGPLLPYTTALLPFAAGAFTPFLITGLISHEIDIVTLGLFVTWGACGALLVGAQFRRLFVRTRPAGRSWWVNLIAGAVYMLALFGIVMETTGKDLFWRGPSGSVLAAFTLTGVLTAITAVALLPREK